MSPLPSARVEFESVRRAFGPKPVIDNFSLKIESGEFVSLLGPSGCGKSTLLRLIAGLDLPDAGRVTTESRERGFVFQEAHLLPWRTVLDNAALPLELMKRPRDEALAAARDALTKVGLSDALDKYPSQLSGGMKMRVSVARALVSRPSLLLLDEPFAALDETTRFKLQEDLRSLWEKLRMTVVFVTHSVSEAVFLSERAVLLGAHPARILVDHRIVLGAQRTGQMRGDPLFLKDVQILTRAFPKESVR